MEYKRREKENIEVGLNIGCENVEQIGWINGLG
jgi:hypothetical protein